MLEKEGYDVMGAAFEVYNTLGCGFLEEVYQQAMEIECEGRGIPIRSQMELKLSYKERPLKKTYLADLIAFESVIIELKAVSSLAPAHVAQLMNYLKASRLSVGYLINFGSPQRLEWRRIALEEMIPRSFPNSKQPLRPFCGVEYTPQKGRNIVSSAFRFLHFPISGYLFTVLAGFCSTLWGFLH